MKQIVTILLFVFTVLELPAQKLPQVKVNRVSLTESNGKVEVSFDVPVPAFSSNHKLILTPVVYTSVQRQALPPLVITGKKKQIFDKRRARYTGTVTTTNTTTAVVTKRNHNSKTLHYQYRFGYEEWMGELSLQLELTLEGCCQEQALAPIPLLTDWLIHYDLKPVFADLPTERRLTALQQFDRESSFLYPASEYASRHSLFEQQREKGALQVNFRQGLSSIDSTYMNNHETLAQVNRALDLIAADSGALLKKIVIVGMASPEGALEKNDKLAIGRAEALKHFVNKRLNYKSDLFEIINGSEDWDGLRRLVEGSHMPYREQVLGLMAKYTVRDGREAELMKLKGGEPYRYMLKHLFPKLRNAGYVQVFYDYSLESTPEAGRVGRATTLLNSKQYTEALAELLKMDGQIPAVVNATGVCYLMTSDYAQAEVCFTRAAEQGDRDAVENLRRLSIYRQVQK